MKLDYENTDEVGRWVCFRTGGVYEPGCSTAIGQRDDDGKLVGGVLFDHYNGRSIAMHVAGEGTHWVSRQLLRAAFEYPFRQLRVKKVLGLVDSTNRPARRFDEHLGFVLEARVRDAGPQGDLLIYSMTADRCRWIRGQNGEHDGADAGGASDQ